MNFPFLNSKKSLKLDDLQSQIASLENQLEEQIDENRDLFIKSIINSSGSEPISGSFGLVDEQYDKGTLQKLFATETWFFIVVHTIAKTIASLPTLVEKKKIVRQMVAQVNGDKEEVFKETWIDASAEPEADLFRFPNDLQTQMEFFMLIIYDLLATGDAYIHTHESGFNLEETSEDRLRNAISRVRKTDVDAMFRLNSAAIEIIPSEEEGCFIDGYAMVTDEDTLFFDKDEVIHIKLPNPSDPFYGLAPIVAVLKKVLLDRYTDEHMMRFYKQGARLGGVISTTKKLTKEQMVRLTKTFENNFTGKRQHHKTLILPEGMEYKVIEQNPGETSLIEFQKNNKEPILSAYNVPPIKIGLLDGATFANAMIQNKTFYVDTIMPITKIIEQAINKSEKILKSTRNMRFRFDFSEIEALQEDFKAKAESGKLMADSGMTVNEVRERVWNLPPIEGGDVTPALSQGGFVPSFSLSAEPGEEKVDATNAQNDTNALADVVPTTASLAERVAQLVQQAQNDGLDLSIAISRAIEQAMEEGFESRDDKQSGHVHVDSKGNETGPDINVGEEGLHYHLIFDGEGKEIGQTSSDKSGKDHVHSDVHGSKTSGPKTSKSSFQTPFSKESLSGYQKIMTGEGVAGMIDQRRKEAEQFMKRLETFIIKKLNKKVYRPKDKSAPFKTKVSLPDQEDLKRFIEEESEKSSEALIKATKHGYKFNIPSKSLAFPNEDAISILKKVSTRNVKSVAKSSLKQLKNIITSSSTEGVSVSEVSARIQDAFGQISASKANTIARTETLTAVSIGQDLKSKTFKSIFPEDAKRLLRVWIDSDDEKVRHSHSDADGEIVKVGEKFSNGLKYPRDPEGDASEVINCRCTFTDFLPEDKDFIVDVLGNSSLLSEEVEQSEKSSKVERNPDESLEECVSRAIPKLIEEGMDQEQAVAAAHNMCKL